MEKVPKAIESGVISKTSGVITIKHSFIQQIHVVYRTHSSCSRCLPEFVQAVITKCHLLGILTQQNFFFPIVLEAGSPKSECQHGQVLVKALCGLQTAGFLLYPYMMEEGPRHSYNSSLYKALISFTRIPQWWLEYLPKASLTTIITFGG